jgi:aconitate hydratase
LLTSLSVASLGLTGQEIFDIEGIAAGVASGFAQSREVTVRARREDGSSAEFKVLARIETPQEVLYYRHGGILQYVLRQLLGVQPKAGLPPAAPQPIIDPAVDPGLVEESSIESFPASDVPSHMGGRATAGQPSHDRQAHEPVSQGLAGTDAEPRAEESAGSPADHQ